MMQYDPAPFYEAGSEGPAVTFGAVDTHNAAQLKAKAEFELKYGHYPPQSLEEANWLNARVSALKAAENVAQVIETDAGLVHATGKPTPKTLTTPVLLAGAGAMGVGLLALAGRRRRNPRRNRWVPLAVVGAAAAALWWGGKRTVEAAAAAMEPQTP